MSAKKSRPQPAVSPPAPAPVEAASWFDSADPRQRLVARIAFVGVWIYVGALWLLALDQTFDWGIF